MKKLLIPAVFVNINYFDNFDYFKYKNTKNSISKSHCIIALQWLLLYMLKYQFPEFTR